MTAPSYRDLMRRAGWAPERISSYERRVERQLARHAEQEAIDALRMIVIGIEVE